jgi:xylulokinase
MEQHAATISPGSNGLICLPYFNGERSPIYDAEARGVFFGISQIHTQSHFLRSMMEGVAYAVRHIFDTIPKHLTQELEFRVTGGGMQNRLWLQIFADVFGQPIKLTRYIDTETLGDAMIVAVNQGVFKTFSEASDSMVQTTETILPNKGDHELYNELYQIYRGLYPQLKELYNRRYILAKQHHWETKSI